MFTQENWCTVEAHEHFIIVYKSVLSVFTQEFSLVVWLRVRPENEPKKIGQCRYFGVFRTDQKQKFALVRPLPPPPPALVEFISPVRSDMMWSIYEINSYWTAAVDESEEYPGARGFFLVGGDKIERLSCDGGSRSGEKKTSGTNG